MTNTNVDSTTPWLMVVVVAVMAYFLHRYVERRDNEAREDKEVRDKAARDGVNSSTTLPSDQPKFVTKVYEGTQTQATTRFQTDRIRMAGNGYFPTSQTWVPGEWQPRQFIIAFLLFIVIIGIFVFLYMLIVNPAGTLTVVYEKQETVAEEKTCPRCAERIKAAALVCRFCTYEFKSGELTQIVGK